MGLLDTGTPLADGDSLTAESIQDKLDIIQDYLNGRNIGRGQLVHDGAIGCVTLSGPNLTLVSGTTKTLAAVMPAKQVSLLAFAWSASFCGLSTALTSTQSITMAIKHHPLGSGATTIGTATATYASTVSPFLQTGVISPEFELLTVNLGSVLSCEITIANEAVGIDMYCPQVTIWYRGQLTTVE